MLYVVLIAQFVRVKNNLLLSTLLLLTSALVIYVGHYNGHLIQSIVYLFTMWLITIVVDLILAWRPIPGEFIVRRPARETVIVLVCSFLGCLFLFVRFVGNWEAMSGLSRLIFVPLILCTFPVALVVIMLLLKYRPKDLGFRLTGWFVSVPVIVILAVATFITVPANIGWQQMLREQGLLDLLFMGFISAALSEELWRVITQTRFAAVLRNNAWGWYLATFIWAFMHAPKWYGESHDLMDTIFSSVRIIPIGLMWGYLTYKTKSIFPSILVHGTNLWGLQNF